MACRWCACGTQKKHCRHNMQKDVEAPTAEELWPGEGRHRGVSIVREENGRFPVVWWDCVGRSLNGDSESYVENRSLPEALNSEGRRSGRNGWVPLKNGPDARPRCEPNCASSGEPRQVLNFLLVLLELAKGSMHSSAEGGKADEWPCLIFLTP